MKMHFIIEIVNGIIDDVENFVLVKVLESKPSEYSYSMIDKVDLEEFIKHTKSIDFKNSIPVGSIDFVKKYLEIVHSVRDIEPLEIPKELRCDKYLKRTYLIVDKNEIPREGGCFLKYASKLKSFTYTGEISRLFKDVDSSSVLKDGKYVISERVELLSEYRCFILNDDIKGIQFYEGDCTVTLGQNDIALIKEMIMDYAKNERRPKAYTLDVAITKDRGVILLECHNHSSVGLYGYDNEILPYHYKFGFEWYLKNNGYRLEKCINEQDSMKDGYLKFSFGYIGEVDNDVFWHGELEHLKKKAGPISSIFTLREAIELKRILEYKE